MTFFCLDILLHGIIPAVTGGFYYDLYTTPLANTVHIYLWICFMMLPLLLYLVCSSIISSRLIQICFFYFHSVHINQFTLRLHLSINNSNIIFNY